MKIDRLIGILSVLLQRDKVTAPMLAEKFEVSRRTINRDIDDICKAGIPIVTTQGRDGGISIMEGFRMEKTLLTSADMQAILTGLNSLDSVCKTNRYRQLMDKLTVGNTSVLSMDNRVLVNLSSWYKPSLAPKIELIQAAIAKNAILSFQYFSPNGDSSRQIEPYLLVFQWSSWYVWGFCLEKSDYRLFKLNRLQELKQTGATFEPRERPVYRMETERIFPVNIEVTVLVEADMKWRVMEEFGPESFTEREDGRLLFRFGFSDRNNLIGWLFSLGDRAELLEPEELRCEIHNQALNIANKYEKC